MGRSEITKPSNTTSKTGAICAAVGAVVLIGAVCIFIVGFGLKLDVLYIAIAVTFLAIGILTLIIGIVLLMQGRKVGRLLSGKDLIAKWSYEPEDNERNKSGYIYIGAKGIYKNGLYTSWSKNYALEAVFLSKGDRKRLVFQYVINKNHSNPNTMAGVRKKISVPVPVEKIEDAASVVTYFLRESKIGRE